MKKSVIFLILVVSIFALAAGCATEAEKAAADLPEFYLNPPQADDALYGVGSAKMSKDDTSRRMAISRAREDIAFQMNAAIEAAIVDYAQESGVDGENQVISFVETISRQVTETTLQGSRTEEIARAADGTMYALVSFPMSNFSETAGEAFSRNEDAAFAEFKADEAQQMLDSQLSDNPPQAGNQEE